MLFEYHNKMSMAVILSQPKPVEVSVAKEVSSRHSKTFGGSLPYSN